MDLLVKKAQDGRRAQAATRARKKAKPGGKAAAAQEAKRKGNSARKGPHHDCRESPSLISRLQRLWSCPATQPFHSAHGSSSFRFCSPFYI